MNGKLQSAKEQAEDFIAKLCKLGESAKLALVNYDRVIKELKKNEDNTVKLSKSMTNELESLKTSFAES